MNKKLVIVMVFFSLILAGCEDKTVATGIIQGKDIRVRLSFPAECQEIKVEEGEKVEKDQELIIFDDTEAKLKVEIAKASLDIAKTNLEKGIKGLRQEEINNAYNQLSAGKEALKAEKIVYENLGKEYSRIQELHKHGAVSESELERIESRFNSEKAKFESQRQNVNILNNKYVLAKKGLRAEDLKVLESQLQIAENNLELANKGLSDLAVKSPIDGIVATIALEEGERNNPQGYVLNVIDKNDIWVKVFVTEDQLGKISLEQEVKIKVDSFEDKTFAGQITYISDKSQFTPKNVQTKEQRITNVYPVKIKIKEGFEELKIGMPADIYFE